MEGQAEEEGDKEHWGRWGGRRGKKERWGPKRMKKDSYVAFWTRESSYEKRDSSAKCNESCSNKYLQQGEYYTRNILKLGGYNSCDFLIIRGWDLHFIFQCQQTLRSILFHFK